MRIDIKLYVGDILVITERFYCDAKVEQKDQLIEDIQSAIRRIKSNSLSVNSAAGDRR